MVFELVAHFNDCLLSLVCSWLIWNENGKAYIHSVGRLNFYLFFHVLGPGQQHVKIHYGMDE